MFHNQKGEIEGVKYAQIDAVLISPVKEQQEQLQQQRKLNEQLQSQLTLQQAQINQVKRRIRRKRH